MNARIIGLGVLAGFVGISLLLATNHYGFAIKVANYFFWFLVLVVMEGLSRNEIKK